MQNTDYQTENDCENSCEEIYSKIVRAGRRTYFFDVKATKNNEFYLTMTESRKKITQTGKLIYEKQKIFLYKEDFGRFLNGLDEVINYVKQNQPEILSDQENPISFQKYLTIDEEFDSL